MNMFRDLLIAGFVILGLSLGLGDPDSWSWPIVGGQNTVQAVHFLADYRPYSFLICYALALALFMTRLKY